METNEIISRLKEDFLDRDSKTFVRARQEGRLGWERSLSSGSPYSGYMLAPASQEDLIKNAYSVAKDMITAMDTPFKVRINITGERSATDGKTTVYVATECFDDKELPAGEKLDVFVGLAVHEGSHLLYTDFNHIGKGSCSAVHHLHNVIEDERIERMLGDSKPGLAHFLAATKYYYYGRYEEKLDSRQAEVKQNKTIRAMNAILSLVRYPKSLEEDDMAEFGEILLKTRDILTPYPKDTAQALEAAEKICSLLTEIPEQGSRDSGQDNNGNGGTPDSLDAAMDVMKDALAEISGMPQGALNQGLPSRRICDKVLENDSLLGKICEGTVEEGSVNGSLVCHEEGDREVYMQSAVEIRKYVPAIAKALRDIGRDIKFMDKGLRSGNLDTTKIAEAFQGAQTVYERKVESRADRCGVCVLIDESGSMRGEKIEAARNTAILLEQALSQVPNLSLFIYGHTSEYNYNRLFVYSEPGRRQKYSLGSARARDCNTDSIAIREAASRVRRYTHEKVLFIVISDGAPCEPVTNVKAAVDMLEKQGFSFIAVSIEPRHDPSLMYRNNITLTDYGRLAIELGKVVKKAIIKNTRRHTF